jgi:predicted ATPase
MRVRFSHLKLANWRNFREVSFPIGARLFVVGPNASGKTNLLDAFRFLRDVARARGGLGAALVARGGIAHLRSLHARHDSRLEVEVRLSIDGVEWGYLLGLTGTTKVPFRIAQEQVTKAGKVLLLRPTAHDLEDPNLLEQTHLEQVTQNGRFRELVSALASTTFIHVVPQVARAGELRANDLAVRDAPGSDFIEQLANLSDKRQKGALGRLGSLLKVAVPQFERLRITREKRSGVPHLEAKFSHWRPQGSWQNERELSDGTVRLIGLLWAILEGESPLVLEEPELSLHAAVVEQLPRLLARAAVRTERQVLLSTHAGSMLNDAGIDPSEIVELTPTREATRATVGSEEPALVDVANAGLQLGELLLARTRPEAIEQLALPLAGER